MFQIKNTSTFSPHTDQSERNNFSWTEHLENLSLIWIRLLLWMFVFTLFHLEICLEAGAVEIKFRFDCRCKSSEWMNETPIQHNDYAYEMWKEITENAMKDEMELHVCSFVVVVADKMVFRANYCTTINISFHIQWVCCCIFVLCRLIRFNRCRCCCCEFEWMDANSNSYDCVRWCLWMWTKRWRSFRASSFLVMAVVAVVVIAASTLLC